MQEEEISLLTLIVLLVSWEEGRSSSGLISLRDRLCWKVRAPVLDLDTNKAEEAVTCGVSLQLNHGFLLSLFYLAEGRHWSHMVL